MDDAAKEQLGEHLISAIKGGDLKKIEDLLSAGADANYRDHRPAVAWAAWYGHTEIVSKFLHYGADITATDSGGMTALMCAANMGHQETAQKLIQSGAGVDATNKRGKTALMCAAASGYQETVTMLIELGARVDTTDNDGKTALMSAAARGRQETVTKLIELGARVDTTNNDGWTALMCAAMSGHQETAQKLIQSGASVDATAKNGWPALMWAARYGHQETASKLIELGARVDTTDNDGWTALICAAYFGHQETTQKLIQSGASVDATDKDGKTAMDLADNNEIMEIIKGHIDAGAKQQHSQSSNDSSHEQDHEDDQDAAALPMPVPVGYRRIPGTSLSQVYLPDDVSENVQIQSLKEFDPMIKANELLLTPVVSVSPQGLEFNPAKPAIIVLPKVAEPNDKHQLVPLCSATDPSQLPNWSEQTECEMLEDHIVLKTNTLGLFAVLARFSYPSSSLSIKPDSDQELIVPELKGFKIQLPSHSLPPESADSEAVEEIKATVYYSDPQYSPENEEHSLASACVDIEPHGLEFTESIPVTLPIPDYAKIKEEEPEAALEIWHAAGDNSSKPSHHTWKRLDSTININQSEDGSHVATSQISQSGFIENRWNKPVAKQYGLGAATAYSKLPRDVKYIREIRVYMSREDISEELNHFGLSVVMDSSADPPSILEANQRPVANKKVRLALGEVSVEVEIDNSEKVLPDESEITEDFWPQFDFLIKVNANSLLKEGSCFGRLHIQQVDQRPHHVNLTKVPLRGKEQDSGGDKFGQLLSATTTDVFSRWNLEKVHSAGITGKGTVIAILDKGINLDHQSVKEKYNRKEIHGDKSAKVTATDRGRPAYHYNAADHGTAVAAVAAGDDVIDGTELQIRCGIAPGAELYVYRLSEDFDHDEVRDALRDVLDHISKAENQVDIICMSFGFTGSNDEIERLLSELAEKGVVCIASAGNDGNFQEMVKFPASSGHVLSVGALTKTGQSSNLNPNDNIDVFAIGENVIVPTSQRGKIQRSAHGTSYAAPMVAGLLSLLMQYAKVVPHHRDDIDRRLHSVSFLKGFFKDHKLCDNRKLVYVDSYFEDLLDYKANVPSSPLEKCVERMFPEK